jgi:hypothetical protein
LQTSAGLTPATGARTTRFCRTLQHRSSAAPPIAHRPKPALQSVQRGGRCRVHRIPTYVRDDRDTPLLAGRNGLICRGDLGAEAVYFCDDGWTGQITLIGLEKLVSSRIASPARLAPGHRPPQKRFRSAGLYFPTRLTVIAYPKFSLVCGGQGVSQFSCMLLLVAALTLTACFGVAAWRISGGGDDVTGSTSSVSIHIR